MTTTEQLIEEYRKNRRRQSFSPGEIRLSEIGGCARRQTLRILGYPGRPYTDQQIAIFGAGDVWEDWLAGIWETRYPGQVDRQVMVETPYGTGHIDLWIVPESRIVECKTTKATSRAYLPMAEHVAQVTMYLHYWGLEHNATAELAYVLKETGEVVAFPVEYNPVLAERLVKKLDRIASAVMEREALPVLKAYTADRFPCGWRGGQCQYWQHCWGERNNVE